MTTDGVPRPPDWKALYQLAMTELDPAMLPQRISDARSAILNRIEDNLDKRRDDHEHQELSDAVNGLRVLYHEYLKGLQEYGEIRSWKTG